MPRFKKASVFQGTTYNAENTEAEKIPDIINLIAEEDISSPCTKYVIIVNKEITLKEFTDIVRSCQRTATSINASQEKYIIIVSSSIENNIIEALKIKGKNEGDFIIVDGQ